MDQSIDQTRINSQDADLEGRREAIRKLGQYAAYAAPFTVLASNMKATGAGSGSGGGPRPGR